MQLGYSPLTELFEPFYDEFCHRFSNDTAAFRGAFYRRTFDIEVKLSEHLQGLSWVCQILERRNNQAVHDALIARVVTRTNFWNIETPRMPTGLTQKVHLKFRGRAQMWAFATLESSTHSTMSAYLAAEIDEEDMYADE